MEISWLGHACTRLRTRQAAVLLDPYERSAGLDMGRPNADIVTVSHQDSRHNYVAGVRGQPLVIEGPGEYEIQGVQIVGIATALRPATEGERPARNTSYVVEAEGLHVAHLGGIGLPPTAEQAEPLSNADVLVLPIDGAGGFGPEEAARTVRALEPAIVIPIGYQPGEAGEASLQAFLKAMGLEPEAPQPKFTIQGRAGLETQRIVLLEPRG